MHAMISGASLAGSAKSKGEQSAARAEKVGKQHLGFK